MGLSGPVGSSARVGSRELALLLLSHSLPPPVVVCPDLFRASLCFSTPVAPPTSTLPHAHPHSLPLGVLRPTVGIAFFSRSNHHYLLEHPLVAPHPRDYLLPLPHNSSPLSPAATRCCCVKQTLSYLSSQVTRDPALLLVVTINSRPHTSKRTSVVRSSFSPPPSIIIFAPQQLTPCPTSCHHLHSGQHMHSSVATVTTAARLPWPHRHPVLPCPTPPTSLSPRHCRQSPPQQQALSRPHQHWARSLPRAHLHAHSRHIAASMNTVRRTQHVEATRAPTQRTAPRPTLAALAARVATAVTTRSARPARNGVSRAAQ